MSQFTLGYRSGDGLVEIHNRDGVPWHEAPVPRRWHRCRPQTIGVNRFDLIERCACGAIRRNGWIWAARNSRR